MWPLLAGRVIYPLHERVLGRSTFRYWRDLERSQWSSPDCLRRLQGQKLRDLLTHAYRNVPFYRARFDEAGVGGALDDPWAALSRLPTLSKADIRQSLSDIVWRDAPGGVYESHTGGSTGEPLTFYFDRRRQAFDQAARLRTHRWFGVQPGDREMYLWGSPIERQRHAGFRRLRDSLFNHCLLDAFNLSPAHLDSYLDRWDRLRPVCLFGYPSSIVRFAEHAKARNRRLDTRALRAVFVTGEVCYDHDRAVIANYFDVPVADSYGSRDAGFIAHQCPQGRMHITAENIIVEILREGGSRESATAEMGEIVITHLDAYAMPLIRYRTGDIGRLRRGRCTCGRGLPIMDVVQGRSTDFLCLPDGNVRHALSIIYPLRETKGVRQFRVVQDEDLRVCVEVVCDEQAARLTAEAVAGRVRPVLGNRIDLEVRFVESLSPNAAGKHRYVISRARPQGKEAQHV